ncbi:MAG: M23 family metallopeptidase [Anaerolineales bacterium]|nr:M23 family metallopeptidase [Anaerolineales bacterium]MDW8162692.1 M23 family metallopeptidase [Anaerolineales bacterium]
MKLSYPFEQVYPLAQGFSELHRGLDWGAPLNTPVLAAADGRVRWIAIQPQGYGLYLTLEHRGGAVTLYAHLERVLVELAQAVSAGQPIALSGNSGNSSGPHLHFEYRPDGKRSVDPSPFFQALTIPLPLDPPSFSHPAPIRVRAGEKVTLRRGYTYVNLRPEPAYAAGVPDIGDFCGGAAVEVLEQQGEMVAIKVWVHGGYLERWDGRP